ncbi:hypothetical protein LCGC14_1548640 [marine sediment metagenome]|uniref:AraC family transcriptional regulator n=2 Tax=root TaxID=1 RepID=A0A831QSN1_9FLAO|nr:AraC family transcriptional regulator [Pricia antarctica]
MIHTSLIGILALIICILFVLFATFLLSVHTEKTLSNRLLACFLLVTAIDISAFFYREFISVPLSLEMLRIQISHLKDPFLFIYFLSVIYADFRLKPKHFIHLCPWIFSICILLPNFFLVSHDEQLQFFRGYGASWEYKFMNNSGMVLEFAYIIAEVYYLMRYRKLLLENYTGKAYFKNYHWLRQLIIFILIGQMLTLVKGYVRDSLTPEFTDDFRVLLLAYGLFLSIWLVWKAMHSPKLFRGIGVNLKLSKELMAENNTTKKPSKEVLNQIEELKNYMEVQKPFLNPGLTVQNLAKDTGIQPKDLSILINQHLGQHFFDFINRYRIESAKEILSNPAKKNLTVLEILYEIGFNSKSSFNTAFKKHTGTTPTSYRKFN